MDSPRQQTAEPNLQCRSCGGLMIFLKRLEARAERPALDAYGCLDCPERLVQSPERPTR